MLGTQATLLTAVGAGAIAVIRVEGPGAARIRDAWFRPAHPGPWVPGRVRLGTFGPPDDPLDEALAIWNPPPLIPQFETLELHLHGSPVIVDAALRGLAKAGMDVGSVGSDRSDRSDALQRSRTLRQAAHLLAQMSPAAAPLDTPGRRALARLLLRPPAVALAGVPNAGKSTLFNAWAGADRALVSPVPGTTRDWLEAWVEADGLPLRLCDLAGLRAFEDEINRAAVEAALAAAADADAIVFLWDPTAPANVQRNWLDRLPRERVVAAIGKADVAPAGGEAAPAGAMRVSGATGEGVDDLGRRVLDRLGVDRRCPWDAPLPLLDDRRPRRRA